MSLCKLASAYSSDKKYVEAESKYQLALSTLDSKSDESYVDSDHMIKVEILTGLGVLYFLQGKPAEGESHYSRAISILDLQYGADNPYSNGFIELAKAMKKNLVGH